MPNPWHAMPCHGRLTIFGFVVSRNVCKKRHYCRLCDRCQALVTGAHALHGGHLPTQRHLEIRRLQQQKVLVDALILRSGLPRYVLRGYHHRHCCIEDVQRGSEKSSHNVVIDAYYCSRD